MDIAANLAFFLLEKTGSIRGKWAGKLTKGQQVELLGAYVYGKKTVHIDGDKETISSSWKVCFGTDSESSPEVKWSDIPLTE
jgi:hypothetical protein